MRRSFGVVLVLGFSLMVVAPALATPTTTTPATTTDSPSKTHTLVITLTEPNGSVGYTVTVSGTVSINGTESGDSIAGQSANGRLGGLPWEKKRSDRKDVIRFTGELRDFEYDGEGKIRITLDGKRIDPAKLVGTPPPPPSTATSTTTSPPNTETATSTTTPTATSSPTTVAPSRTPSSNGGMFGVDLPLSFVIALVGAALIIVLRWTK